MKCLTRSPTLKRIMRGLFWEMITQVLSSGRTNCSLIFLGAFSSKLNLSRVLRCQELCVFRIMRLQNYASSELCVFRIMRLQNYASSELCVFRIMRLQNYASSLGRTPQHPAMGL